MSSRVLRTTRKENKTRLTIDKGQAFSLDKETSNAVFSKDKYLDSLLIFIFINQESFESMILILIYQGVK